MSYRFQSLRKKCKFSNEGSQLKYEPLCGLDSRESRLVGPTPDGPRPDSRRIRTQASRSLVGNG